MDLLPSKEYTNKSGGFDTNTKYFVNTTYFSNHAFLQVFVNTNTRIHLSIHTDLKFVTTFTTSGRVKNIPAVQMFPDNNVFLCQICAKNEIYTFIW